jgi:hypothetical protein
MPPRRQPLERNYDEMVDANALHITEEQANTFGEPREVLKASEAQALRQRASDSEHLRQQVADLEAQLQAHTDALMVQDGTLVVQGFQLSPTGLIPPENFSEASWEQIGSLLFKLEGSIQWLIGDWLAYGVDLRYGDIRKLAEELLRDENTLSNYKMVCQGVEFPRRRGNLSFGHHEVVYAYTPEEQDYYLHYAEYGEEKKLSVSRFRAWVKEQRGQNANTRLLPPALRFKAIGKEMDKFMDRDPSTAKPGERETALSYAAQMRTWLEAYEKKWRN